MILQNYKRSKKKFSYSLNWGGGEGVEVHAFNKLYFFAGNGFPNCILVILQKTTVDSQKKLLDWTTSFMKAVSVYSFIFFNTCLDKKK